MTFSDTLFEPAVNPLENDGLLEIPTPIGKTGRFVLFNTYSPAFLTSSKGQKSSGSWSGSLIDSLVRVHYTPPPIPVGFRLFRPEFLEFPESGGLFFVCS